MAGTGKIGGKRSSTKREPIPNDAGDLTKGTGGEGGAALGFKGPGTKPYSYVKTLPSGVKIIRTVWAHNVIEADRLAATIGYKPSDREIKRGDRRKKS